MPLCPRGQFGIPRRLVLDVDAFSLPRDVKLNLGLIYGLIMFSPLPR